MLLFFLRLFVDFLLLDSSLDFEPDNFLLLITLLFIWGDIGDLYGLDFSFILLV